MSGASSPSGASSANAVGARPFGWPAIVRLGLVQAAIGAIVVLTTSTLNRVMVVELGLPALLPGLLLALHHAVQVVRPRVGHGTDGGRRRTPWIVGGMAVLCTGGLLATFATLRLATDRPGGLVLAVLAFVLIGLGVAAAGTSLLALLAQRVAPARRAAAATTVWMLMIAGFVVTAATAGALLEPYSPARLFAVAAGVCAAAFALTLVALAGLEGRAGAATVAPEAPAPSHRFGPALRALWREREARGFTVFVFVSMLAFSAQDLILEPFAGAVFGLTPGGSTRLSGLQHAGALVGMLLAAGAGRRVAGLPWGGLRAWTVGGCLASALALGGLALAGMSGGTTWPLRANVFALGLATGAFSIAAIGSMMRLAAAGGPGREGLRMGLFGAAQALAFALGGVLGTGATDLARGLLGSPGPAYACVFALEAAMFVIAARLAARIGPVARTAPPATAPRPRHEAAGLL